MDLAGSNGGMLLAEPDRQPLSSIDWSICGWGGGLSIVTPARIFYDRGTTYGIVAWLDHAWQGGPLTVCHKWSGGLFYYPKPVIA